MCEQTIYNIHNHPHPDEMEFLRVAAARQNEILMRIAFIDNCTAILSTVSILFLCHYPYPVHHVVDSHLELAFLFGIDIFFESVQNLSKKVKR